jgi:hypothetical protein
MYVEHHLPPDAAPGQHFGEAKFGCLKFGTGTPYYYGIL